MTKAWRRRPGCRVSGSLRRGRMVRAVCGQAGRAAIEGVSMVAQQREQGACPAPGFERAISHVVLGFVVPDRARLAALHRDCLRRDLAPLADPVWRDMLPASGRGAGVGSGRLVLGVATASPCAVAVMCAARGEAERMHSHNRALTHERAITGSACRRSPRWAGVGGVLRSCRQRRLAASLRG